jgi:hypothetical protein
MSNLQDFAGSSCGEHPGLTAVPIRVPGTMPISKTWNAKLLPVVSHCRGGKQLNAINFQILLAEKSHDRKTMWKTHCPVFISTQGDFIAYCEVTHNWKILQLVSLMPTAALAKKSVQITGVLLYASNAPAKGYDFHGKIYIASVLTWAWKMLPLPPSLYSPVLCCNLVIAQKSSESYR